MLQRSETHEALALIDRALDDPHVEQAGFTSGLIQILKARGLLAIGRFEIARRLLLETLEAARNTAMGLVAVQALTVLGMLALDREDGPGARKYLAEAHALCASGPLRNPLHEAIAGRLLGEVALFEGARAEARTRFEAALAIAERPELDNWIEQAHGHRCMGEWHLASGGIEAAKQDLRRAGVLYHRLKSHEGLHEVTRLLEKAHHQPLAYLGDIPIEARWKFMSGLLN